MSFKVALCQMLVKSDKHENLNKAEKMIREAHQGGARMIALPEMFNCPYDSAVFRDYAEEADGETVQRMSAIAKELGIYLISGSIPEKADRIAPKSEGIPEESDRIAPKSEGIPEQSDIAIYNTCFVFDPKGHIIGKHRKVHLFDIAIKGGIQFKESSVLDRGNDITVVETEFCKIGIAICYDMRFPELIRLMSLKGAKLIIVPGAFNMTTGPAHWELTMKARALDNQVYFAAVSPARDMAASYHAYGHSGVVNPWGAISGQIDEKEGIVFTDIDLDYIEEIRQQLPLMIHRREDVYKLEGVEK